MINLSETWTNVLDFWGQAWWVEVSTTQPRCTYYFGPFADRQQAGQARQGYVEDLESESAHIIQTKIERCKPAQLTIEFEDAPAPAV
jgi:Domain of unknown function (DUF1816)